MESRGSISPAKMDSPDAEETVFLSPKDCCDVLVQIVSQPNQERHSALVVHANSQVLSHIPYFSTRFSDQCCSNQLDPANPVRLTLECVASSSPRAYRQCFELLPSFPSISCSSAVLKSVSDALELIYAADHLLLKQCAHACMHYLCAVRWSVEEEDAIRSTVSSLGLTPPSDLAERLDSSQDVVVFENLISHLLSLTHRPGAFTAFAQKSLSSSSNAVVKMSTTVLMRAWTEVTKKFCHEGSRRMAYGSASPTLCKWILLTKVLVLCTDAKEILQGFITFTALPGALRYRSVADLKKSELVELTSKVIGKVSEGEIILSNSDRLSLVREWTVVAVWLEDPGLTLAMRMIFETLPLQDPGVWELIKKDVDHSKPEHYTRWSDRLLHRMGQSKELDLKVSQEIDTAQ